MEHKCVPVPPEGHRRMVFVLLLATLALEAEGCHMLHLKHRIWCS